MSLKKKLVKGWWQYEIPNNLCQRMFEVEKEATQNTYPKPGKYAVALLTSTGNIYPGVSYHSDVYTLTMHAEMTALANAAINGEKEVIAITGPNCHICKQLLWESAIRSEIDPIIILEEQGRLKRIPLSEMMVYPWPDKEGNK